MTTSVEASRFHIRYDGDAIREGQMDARLLADSLLAVTDALEKGNKLLNGKDSTIAVKVDANMQPGSFIITMATIKESLVSIGIAGSGETIGGWVNITALLGFGGTVGVVVTKSLLRLLKEKKGREIIRCETADNGAQRALLDDGDAIDGLSREVIALYEDQSVRLAIETMTQALNRDGVASMEFWEGDDAETAEIIEQAEAPYFKASQSGVLLEETAERILIITHANLSGEPTGWRFKYDSNDFGDFAADVVDPLFLDDVKQAKIHFSNGDMMKVSLQTQQSRPRRNLRTVYTVQRVIEFMPFES